VSAAGDLEGGRAPDFSGTTDTGETLKLSSLRGRTVVLFFYPKDDTSGCTTEACSLRDTLPRFDALDAVVIGVSPDSPKSHQKFKKKYDLPYTLIADVDHAIAVKYGVWGEKSMYGRKYMGMLRATFLIDSAGKVAKVFEKVKPEGHGDEVAKVLAAQKTRG
jgi:thioredoxin-dependent peroxiredoxin